jgi:hypothetical protein
MANSNVNTAWKQDLYPLINKSFEFNYANRMNKLLEIVSEEDINSVDYRMAGMGGYGELTSYDGSNLKGMNQKRGFITIVTPQEYAGSIDIQYKYAKIDKSGEAKKVGTRAAYSAQMTVYLALLRMMSRAFNSNYVGGDGKAWAATDHPNASKSDLNGASVADTDSGTYSNLITTALSVSAINTAQSAANRFVTPDGLPFMCDFWDNGILLVSPELEAKAIEICGKDSKMSPEKLPESAENGANPIYGMKYMVIGGGSDGFTAKQWAIADRMLLKECAKIVYITRPTVKETDLDNPLVARYVPYIDFATAWADGRPIIFSNPA